MAKRKRNTKKIKQDSSFCTLPDEAIDVILTYLPIKDAVRTSILSRDWRFKWHNMSKLVFNDECLPFSTNKDYLVRELVHIVDSVLTLHVGTVEIFDISVNLPSSSDVSRWITFLSRNQIREINLNFNGSGYYDIPSHIFNCETLTHLELWNCVFKLPASFQQLAKLTTLILSRVCDPGGRLEALISCCPSLRVLSLIQIDSPKHLNIIAPNLHEVYVRETYFDLSFGSSPNLAKATFWITDPVEKTYTVNLLHSLPNIRKLQLAGCAIQLFPSIDRELERGHLKSLYIDVDFHSEEEFGAVLCLIRNFPNLEVLNIQISGLKVGDSTANSLKSKNCDLTFTRLKTVKIADMTGTEQELHLIRCILMTAPLLETLTICIYHDENVFPVIDILTSLMRYPRASTQAEIIYTHDLILNVD